MRNEALDLAGRITTSVLLFQRSHSFRHSHAAQHVLVLVITPANTLVCGTTTTEQSACSVSRPYHGQSPACKSAFSPRCGHFSSCDSFFEFLWKS
jgi:hypothetical protein